MNKGLSKKNKGIICIILAAFFFSLMSVFIRLAGDDVPLIEKAYFRNIMAAAISWVLVVKKKEKLRVGRGNRLPVFMRCAFGTAAIVCNFYAIANMNISDANLLNKLSPFFAILMSIFILKEKAGKWEWFAVILAFSGALLVVKPGFSMNSIPAFVGVAGGFGAGLAYTYLRKATMHGVAGSVIVFYFSMFSSIVMLPVLILQFQPVSLLQFVFLMGIGLSAAGGQLSITAAYSYAPAKEISVFDYTQVLFAAAWGFFLFDQIPDIFSFIGYIVILIAVLLRFLYNQRKG